MAGPQIRQRLPAPAFVYNLAVSYSYSINPLKVLSTS